MFWAGTIKKLNPFDVQVCLNIPGIVAFHSVIASFVGFCSLFGRLCFSFSFKAEALQFVKSWWTVCHGRLGSSRSASEMWAWLHQMARRLPVWLTSSYQLLQCRACRSCIRYRSVTIVCMLKASGWWLVLLRLRKLMAKKGWRLSRNSPQQSWTVLKLYAMLIAVICWKIAKKRWFRDVSFVFVLVSSAPFAA